MSTIDRTPLDGFEARLLTQLKAQVTSHPSSAPHPSRAAQPTPAAQPNRTATASGRLTRRPRVGALLTASAAIAAMLVTVLYVLSGSTPTLAQAFPILTGRTHGLPALVKRILRSQRLAASNLAADPKRAYSFRTPVGIGYVVVDRSAKWLCIVVPGFSTDRGSVRCETAIQLLARNSTGIELAASRDGREEVVIELPRTGAATTVTDGGGASRRAVERDGILTVVSHRPVTITTTINGRRSSTTYSPRGASRTRSARSRSLGCVGRQAGSHCDGGRLSASAAVLAMSPRRSRWNCAVETCRLF
jgi:hypothetical protein